MTKTYDHPVIRHYEECVEDIPVGHKTKVEDHFVLSSHHGYYLWHENAVELADRSWFPTAYEAAKFIFED